LVIFIDIVTLFGYQRAASRNCDSPAGGLPDGSAAFCIARARGVSAMARRPGKRIAIRPSLRQGEGDRINNNWRRLFLDHLAETSNVTSSAAKAGISISRAYKVRREEAEWRICATFPVGILPTAA
jgi:hypothetical protein